ncbi:uncharacterized protein LOC144132290 [Amblyomma americanum]
MAANSKRQTHCFAPGCTTGYVSARKKGNKVSVFSVPNDEEKFRAWQKVIPRANKPVEKSSVLCELHFDERFIVRDYTHIVNGEVVKIPRGRPCLSDDAVPTLFPNTPSYLSKRLPPKRKSKTSSGEILGKKRKVSDDSPQEATSFDDASTGETAVHDTCNLRELEHLSGDNLPTEYWSKSLIAGMPETVAFSVCAPDNDSLCFRKLLLCSAHGDRYHCSVFVQGVSVKKVDVFDAVSVEGLLRSVNEMNSCAGLEKDLAEEKFPRTGQVKYRRYSLRPRYQTARASPRQTRHVCSRFTKARAVSRYAVRYPACIVSDP